MEMPAPQRTRPSINPACVVCLGLGALFRLNQPAESQCLWPLLIRKVRLEAAVEMPGRRDLYQLELRAVLGNPNGEFFR